MNISSEQGDSSHKPEYMGNNYYVTICSEQGDSFHKHATSLKRLMHFDCLSDYQEVFNVILYM